MTTHTWRCDTDGDWLLNDADRNRVTLAILHRYRGPAILSASFTIAIWQYPGGAFFYPYGREKYDANEAKLLAEAAVSLEGW